MDFEFIKHKTFNNLSEYEKKDLQLITEIQDVYILQKIRESQTLFKNNLIKKFNSKCVISNNILIECEAAHIKPVKNYGTYEINNGLLLTSNLHKTFDLFLWSINPITFEIVLSKKYDSGSIKKYDKYCLVNILDETYTENLTWHYNIFLEMEK